MLLEKRIKIFRMPPHLELPKNRWKLRTRCQAPDEDPYYSLTKIWAQNRKFYEVVIFEPEGISTRSKR